MRPVILGDRLVYQAEYSFPKKVTHTNLEAADAVSTALRLVEEDFKQVNIFTASEEIQVLASKPQNPRITSKKSVAVPTCMPVLSHNKTKNYIIPDGVPCGIFRRAAFCGGGCRAHFPYRVASSRLHRRERHRLSDPAGGGFFGQCRRERTLVGGDRRRKGAHFPHGCGRPPALRHVYPPVAVCRCAER